MEQWKGMKPLSDTKYIIKYYIAYIQVFQYIVPHHVYAL